MHHKVSPYCTISCYQFPVVGTLFHTESLIGLVGRHLQLFLNLNMLPLERSVLKDIVLIALLQNELEQIFDVESSRAVP